MSMLSDIYIQKLAKDRLASINKDVIEKVALNALSKNWAALSEAARAAMYEVQKPSKKLFSGELRDAPERAIPYKIKDYARDLGGLNRGSYAIRDKVNPDIPILRSKADLENNFDKIKQSYETVNNHYPGDIMFNYSLKNLLYDKAYVNMHWNSSGGAKGSLNKGIIVAPEKSGLKSAEEKWDEALKLRHEVDEERSILNTFRKGKNRATKGLKVGALDISSNHVSPDVLFQESANVAKAPSQVRNDMTRLRLGSNEVGTVAPLYYGDSPVIDKKRLNWINKKLDSFKRELQYEQI